MPKFCHLTAGSMFLFPSLLSFSSRQYNLELADKHTFIAGMPCFKSMFQKPTVSALSNNHDFFPKSFTALMGIDSGRILLICCLVSGPKKSFTPIFMFSIFVSFSFPPFLLLRDTLDDQEF